MSALYVDTSALVKFYYPEEGSEAVERRLLKASRVFLAQLCLLEMASALAKKLRARELGPREKSSIWTAFLSDLKASPLEVVPIRPGHLDHAVDLVNEFGKTFGLRSLDAVHLAVARLVPCDEVLTSDKRMAAVGRKLAMKVTYVS